MSSSRTEINNANDQSQDQDQRQRAEGGADGNAVIDNSRWKQIEKQVSRRQWINFTQNCAAVAVAGGTVKHPNCTQINKF